MLNKETGNKRIGQIAFMLCSIVEMSFESAEQMVKSTDIGKLILDDDQTVLYEQQTENLAEIALEFSEKNIHPDIVSQLTIENIVSAALKLRDYEKKESTVRKKVTCQANSKDETLKNNHQKDLKQKEKRVLMIKMQNKINARRIENANKIKK